MIKKGYIAIREWMSKLLNTDIEVEISVNPVSQSYETGFDLDKLFGIKPHVRAYVVSIANTLREKDRWHIYTENFLDFIHDSESEASIFINRLDSKISFIVEDDKRFTLSPAERMYVEYIIGKNINNMVYH